MEKFPENRKAWNKKSTVDRIMQFNHLYNKGIENGLLRFKPWGDKELKRWINLCSFTSKTLGLLMSKIETEFIVEYAFKHAATQTVLQQTIERGRNNSKV